MEYYIKAGIDVIENSPEEIQVAAIEMDDRLNGVWTEPEEDRQLQKRFWNIRHINKQCCKEP